jgi:hypothetical protein
MRTIYIDSDYRCHVTNDGTTTAVETDFFDGKCDTFVEGYCYDTRNGYVQIYPVKPFSELDAAQREYERKLLEEYEAALAESVPLSALEEAYREGVNSAYES